ncbi:MAG: hypothetical protein IIB19_07805 [Chloroflexi bacterium]|nr:hypothetical protein [Chloroflexota bacterium]
MSRWSSEGGDTPPDEGEEDGDEEELEGQWELDPNDPTHPDYDLSESAGYADWEPAPKPVFLMRGVILGFTLLVLGALMIPLLLRLL